MATNDNKFEIYPAIDLRAGQVVRLEQGDPTRQTRYSPDPAEVARRWLAAGASWLHVVNLDGAFGQPDQANQSAVRAVLSEAAAAGARVQLGGGLRSLADIRQALVLGVERVILGTAAVEDPGLVQAALQQSGPQGIVLGLDARQGKVQVRGWAADAGLDVLQLGRQYAQLGIQTAVFTNVERDGLGRGIDVETTRQLAETTGLEVIASGGAASLEDVRACRQAGLKGIILGKALYTGAINLEEALRC